MTRKLIAAVLIVALPARAQVAETDDRPAEVARAEPLDDSPMLRLTQPVDCTMGAKAFQLPQGYFLTDRQYGVLDTEVRRLQGREVELQAQVQNLGETLAQQPRAGTSMRAILIILAVGVGTGVVVGYAGAQLLHSQRNP